jgi:hypothetical protein
MPHLGARFPKGATVSRQSSRRRVSRSCVRPGTAQNPYVNLEPMAVRPASAFEEVAIAEGALCLSECEGQSSFGGE